MHLRDSDRGGQTGASVGLAVRAKGSAPEDSQQSHGCRNDGKAASYYYDAHVLCALKNAGLSGARRGEAMPIGARCRCGEMEAERGLGGDVKRQQLSKHSAGPQTRRRVHLASSCLAPPCHVHLHRAPIAVDAKRVPYSITCPLAKTRALTSAKCAVPMSYPRPA